MAEAKSPAIAMSPSVKAKKVSMTEDEPALAAWITEVVETLSRPAGNVKVAIHHVTKVKDQLSDLRENGDEVDPEQLEELLDILTKDAAICRRLEPGAFALLVEVLLETNESKVRERGFYILAKSLHEEACDARDSFAGRLHEIGRGCLIQLYERFVEKAVAYGSRRWMGCLLMELIGDSEENQQDIAMMSTSKRAKLGSAVLYESSEIIRAMSGRLLAVMLGADHEARNFFPPGTSEKLFKDYPSSDHSGSLWDKAFQAYVDEIWKAIEAYNDSGELRFAQHIATVPSHPGIESAALARNRSIYIEISDSVRVYMRLGNDHFDSAVDIPLTSIEGIETTLTLVDQSQSKEYVDVVLRLKPSTHSFVNSTQASLSVVRLTVESQEMADGVRDGIILCLAAMAEANNEKSHISVAPTARANTHESSQSRKSYGDEDLVLNGSYESPDVNGSFVAVAATMKVSEVATIVEDPFIASVHEARPIVIEVAQGIQGPEAASNVTGNYDEQPVLEEQTLLSRTAVELDVVKDVNTGEVLSSKVLGLVVVPNVRRRPSIKVARSVTEAAIERSANGCQDNPYNSEDTEPEVVENVVTPRPREQAVKSKASANDRADLDSIIPPPMTQRVKPKDPAKDTHGQPSNAQEAESDIMEKITASSNQQTLMSEALADSEVHPSFAQDQDQTAAVDAGQFFPKKQDVNPKAGKGATLVQQYGRDEDKLVESERVIIPPAKKQALKSKTPIGVAKRKGDKISELKRSLNKPPKTSSLEPELQALSFIEEEGAQKKRLVTPSEKNIETTSKGSTEGNFSKQPLTTDADDEDIYDFIPSPPKVEKNGKAGAKGKKGAATTASFKGYGKKSKAKDQLFLDREDKEDITTTKPVKFKKEPIKKKQVKQPAAPPLGAAAAPKRQTAPRSTKGKKSMKDLSDSEIENDELLIVAEPQETKGSTIVANAKAAAVAETGHEAGKCKVVTKPAPNQQDKQDVSRVTNLSKEAIEVQVPDTVKAHPEIKQKSTGKPKAAITVITGQPKVNRHATLVDSQDTKQWPPVNRPDSSPTSQIDHEDPFNDPLAIASLGHSDDVDMALASTAGVQKTTGSPIEARIGRKMAEILGFASTKAQKKPQKTQQVADPPKNTELLGDSHPAVVLETKKPADDFDNTISASSSNDGSEAIQEDNGFFVLSSPPNLIEDVATATLQMNLEHSSADDPIVLSSEEDEDDDEEEESVAQVPVNKAIVNRPTLTPVAETPTKRQRTSEEASLFSPSQPQGVSSPAGATPNVKAQAPGRAVPISGSNPYLAAATEAASFTDQSTLLDDYQARKAPLISFGPHGPRNQGLSSAIKLARMPNKEKTDSLSALSDDLSKRTVEKRPSSGQQFSHATFKPTARTPHVPSFEDSLARYNTIAMDFQADKDDGLTFFDAGQSVASSRSHSRVDVNGSPKARRAPLAQIVRHRGSQTTLKSDVDSTTRSRPQRYTAPSEKASSKATFEDDTTLFGSGLFISSNRKARPAAPDDDLDFESRYTPHHAAKNGDYVGVADLKVVDAALEMADPFSKKVKRQDSDFAQRLRLSQTLNAGRHGKTQKMPTSKAQGSIQPPAKSPPIQSHLSFVADADADATLVDIENRRPQQKGRSRQYHESSSESSDSEAEAYEERYKSPPLDPQHIWNEALKPHQKDVSNVLHHVVDGLLQQLFDTEPAVHAIANEYRANGAKIVEALRSRMDSEIMDLCHHATSTIEGLATSLRQSRAALQSDSGAVKTLDDQYRQWRAGQHALQLLPFMAREDGRRR